VPFLKIINSGEIYKVNKGKSILDIAYEKLIEINHNCGGVAACTSCIIYIRKGNEYLNNISEDELYQLREDNKYSPWARLACQCRIITDEDVEITIEIPGYSE
jgi:2Fe-2S ferredoxin